MKFCARIFVILTALLLLAAPQPRAQAQEDVQGAWTERYLLAPGDHIRVTVYGEDDLSGARRIDAGGAVALPLVGAVNVAGHDPEEAARKIAEKLQDGFLRQPRVTVAMESYRPIYLLGDVKNPGEYSYREGMTVLQAVALGGGFAGKGHDHTADITRRCGADEITQRFAVDGTAILPGDILTVQGRWRYHE